MPHSILTKKYMTTTAFPRISRNAIIFATLTLAYISAAQSFAGGIIFYTSGGSPYVNVVQYETYTAPNAHLSYITVKGGQKTQIQSAGIIANIPLPTTGSEYSLEDIQTNIAQANAMASRQPKYAQAMQKVSQLWNDQIPAAEALQKRRLAEEAAAKKKAAEDAEKNRIAKEADDKRLAADVEQKKKNDAEAKLTIEKDKLASDKMQKEYEAKLAALSEKANEIRFVIRRKLDPKNFPLISRFTGDYYEIELDGELAILATTHTNFSSSGVASVFVGASSEKQIKLNDGFEKTVKLYQESNPADIKRLLDCIDQGPKPVVEGGSPSASTSIPVGGKPTMDSPFENSLGMKFVPIPGIDVLFSVYDTRVQEYEAFVKASGHPWTKPLQILKPTFPAMNVSWLDAKAFCQWLTEKERGEGKITASQKYRLPMDAEWSVAVGSEKYPWGSEWPPPEGAGHYSFLRGGEDGFWMPCGSFSANKYGLYDMGGNVLQWCEDWYRAEMNERVLLDKRTGLKDDGGGQTYRVLRGAAAGEVDPESPELLLSSIHICAEPDKWSPSWGFRCVLVDGSNGNNAPQSRLDAPHLSNNKDFTVSFGNDSIIFHADGAITSTGTSDLKISRGKLINDPIELLRTKAEEKDAEALYELGIRYLTGSGIEENLKNATETLLKASLEGQQDAKKLFMYIGKH